MRDPVTTTERRPYEIAEALRAGGSAEFHMIREMVGISLENARRKLVLADSQADIFRVQGEARAFDKLYRRLTEPSPVLQE